MKIMDREQLDRHIAYIKRKGFTHLKVELEADLDRGGDYDDEESCYNCDGEGQIMCFNCDGDGCDSCDDEGYITCEDCNGRSGSSASDTIYNLLSQEAREALVYSLFYNDGSVDSEYTFTIPVEKAHTLPSFINAFKELAATIGNGINTDRAGMHISVMTAGSYPDLPGLNNDKVRNFKVEMAKLMPALFVLASPDHKSRELQFRNPRVSESDKYSAIKIGRGHIEYRVFETCYQRPEAIFDNLAVIAKSLKFYGTPKVKQQFFTEFRFPDHKRHVGRFFQDGKQNRYIDMGLRILKPEHKSVEEIKAERGVKAPDKLTEAKEKAKTLAKYGEYVQSCNARIWRELRNSVASYATLRRHWAAGETYYLSDHHRALVEAPTKKQGIADAKKVLQQYYTPMSLENWLGRDGYDGYTLRLPRVNPEPIDDGGLAADVERLRQRVSMQATGSFARTWTV